PPPPRNSPLSLHDALPILQTGRRLAAIACSVVVACSPTSTTRPDAAPTASLTGTPSPETVRDDLAQFEVKVVSAPAPGGPTVERSEEHTSELQSRFDLVCR